MSVQTHATDPQCIKWDSQCNNDWREGCQNVSQDLWPHLNITVALEHYNNDWYGIAISWDQPGNKVIEPWSESEYTVLSCCSLANVTGYMLQMTKEPVNEARCSRGRECTSVNITSQVCPLCIYSGSSHIRNGWGQHYFRYVKFSDM